jgi:large subunit ribosomal protein L24
MMKKHLKPSQMNPEGGILETEAAIHVSNVMHVDPESGERTRIRHEIKEDGTKVRVAVKSGKEIPTVQYDKN